MRVITGTARGRRLESPEGMEVRPTSEKVKEAVFSMIQFELPGARFLDLFAGSGQMGIEALSREASGAVFVDAASASIAVVRENLARTGLSDRAQVVMLDAKTYLSAAADSFDLAFVDPPYAESDLTGLLGLLLPHMRPQGAVLVETDGRTAVPESVGGWTIGRQKRYGRTLITCYRKGETA